MTYESIILEAIYATGTCDSVLEQIVPNITCHIPDQMGNQMGTQMGNQMGNRGNMIDHAKIKDKIVDIFHHLAGRLKVFDGADRFINFALDLIVDACASMENKVEEKMIVVPRHSIR